MQLGTTALFSLLYSIWIIPDFAIEELLDDVCYVNAVITRISDDLAERVIKLCQHANSLLIVPADNPVEVPFLFQTLQTSKAVSRVNAFLADVNAFLDLVS